MKKKMDRQIKPFVIKMELTEGCNLYCKFCGIKSIRKKTHEFKFMTIKTATKIIENIANADWQDNIRFEFAMHGEPLFNPDALSILSIVRNLCTKSSIVITSNGGAILENKIKIDDIMQYANILALDDYDQSKIIPKLLKRKKLTSYEILDFSEINIYKRHKPDFKAVVIVKDLIRDNKSKIRNVHNTAGNSGKLDFSKLKQRCAMPFRECTFNYKGDMLLCCLDWKHEFKIGNIFDCENIQDLWNHKNIVSARKILFHFGRKFSICHGCNAPSSKVGLLPDIKAQHTLSLPRTIDYKNVNKYRRSK